MQAFRNNRPPPPPRPIEDMLAEMEKGKVGGMGRVMIDEDGRVVGKSGGVGEEDEFLIKVFGQEPPWSGGWDGVFDRISREVLCGRGRG